MSPVSAGGLVAIALLGVLFVVAWGSGDLVRVVSLPEQWWQNRDVRLAILVSLLAAAVLTSTRTHAVGTRENLVAVARLGGWRPEEIDPAEGPRNRFGERRAALLGALIVPFLALLVDRDPTLYFESGYWQASKAWTWLLGIVTLSGFGVLSYRTMRDARHFSALAHRLPEIDLLDPGRLSPFARQGLRCSVPGLVGITFVALNGLDQGFLFAIVALGGLAIVEVTLALATPLRGLRERIRRAKREEIARTNGEIRGEAGALRDSAIEHREAPPTLSDLLAYRALVASVPEWPLDFSIMSRFGLYVAVPVASWLGGALVERALDAALR